MDIYNQLLRAWARRDWPEVKRIADKLNMSLKDVAAACRSVAHSFK